MLASIPASAELLTLAMICRSTQPTAIDSRGGTYLLNDPHESMLLRFRQLLYALDDLLVVLALHGNSNSQATHHQQGRDIDVLGDGLQVGYVQRIRRLVQYVGEVLGHETIQSFEGTEPQDPIL